MSAGSDAALAAVLEKTEEVLGDGEQGVAVGDDLFGFARTLDQQHALRRALTEPAVPLEAKSSLLRRLMGDQLDEKSLQVIESAIDKRWSRAGDLADTLESASVTAHVAQADKHGQLDELEDHLFRFGRIVEGNAAMRDVLADREKPLAGKRAMLETLLEGKVDEPTKHLLGQAVAVRRRSLAAVLASYQKVAASRRDSLVATVWVAAPISEDQRERLSAALAKQYDKDVHLNFVVDPQVLGGVRVAIADEVIDSTVQTRLRLAQRRLER